MINQRITDYRKLQAERPKTIMIDTAKEWYELPKEEKMVKIKAYLKKIGVEGKLNEYKFTDIKYNKHMERVMRLNYTKRN